MSFTDSNIFTLGILPLLIFFARVCDVSMGTIRIMFVSKGNKILAPLLGFFEILIWLMAIGLIMHNLTSIHYYFAFAGGFSVGTFVGIQIESKLALGKVIVRIITKKESLELVSALRSAGYGVTCIDAMGAKGKVNVIYTIINRNEIDNVVCIINELNPKAFYSIEDIKRAHEGVFPKKTCFSNKKSFLQEKKAK